MNSAPAPVYVPTPPQAPAPPPMFGAQPTAIKPKRQSSMYQTFMGSLGTGTSGLEPASQINKGNRSLLGGS